MKNELKGYEPIDGLLEVSEKFPDFAALGADLLHRLACSSTPSI
ncbi:MAG: hypothetical protein ACFCVA_04815 [Gammaproteobacteria bacterium]